MSIDMNQTKELENLLDAVETLIESARSSPEDEYATPNMIINSYDLHNLTIAYESFIKYLDEMIYN